MGHFVKCIKRSDITVEGQVYEVEYMKVLEKTTVYKLKGVELRVPADNFITVLDYTERNPVSTPRVGEDVKRVISRGEVVEGQVYEKEAKNKAMTEKGPKTIEEAREIVESIKNQFGAGSVSEKALSMALCAIDYFIADMEIMTVQTKCQNLK